MYTKITIDTIQTRTLHNQSTVHTCYNAVTKMGGVVCGGCLSWLSSDSTAEGTSLTPVLIVPKDFHKALFIQK